MSARVSKMKRRADLARKGAAGAPAAVGAREPGAGEWDWEAIYELAPGLIALAMRRYNLGSRDAEDALQKTALSVAFSGSAPRNREAYFTASFLNACWHVAREEARRSARETPLEEAELTHVDPVGRLQAACLLYGALGHVPPHCRELLQKWAIEGYNAREAARLLSWSVATVYKRLARCMKRLADVLTR